MHTREKILGSIVTGKPALLPHPGAAASVAIPGKALIDMFITTLESIGGQVITISGTEAVLQDMAAAKGRGEWVVNSVDALGPVSTGISMEMRAARLAAIDRAFLHSSMGIAENGAVWLKENEMLNRLLPFICQHLVILLHARDLVPNMHEAYKKISGTDAGFHLFLAGPSKTADIEQSLVIGAHGARSLLLYLICD